MLNDYFHQEKTMVSKLEKAFSDGSFEPTIAELQNDYANDDRICLTSVVFIPAQIAEIIKEQFIEPLRKIEPEHYYYAVESLHITVKNIKTIANPPLFDEEDVKKVRSLFSKVIPRHSTFDYVIEDAILFPTGR